MLRRVGGWRREKVAIRAWLCAKKSIATNAKIHRNKRWVLNLDLENFFGNINFGRVRGLLIKDKNFALNETVATLIAQIVCFKNQLPQGAPTSPIISNLVARPLDLKLVDLAKKYGCNYTRFADDITFSTSKEQFSEHLAVSEDDGVHKWVLGEKLNGTLTKSGFVANPKKTRLQYFKSQQQVTGLVVNKRINVTREYRKSVRVMLDKLLRTGTFDLPTKWKQRAENKNVNQMDLMRRLQGMLGFIDWVDLVSKTNAKDLSIHQQKLLKTKSYKENELTSQEKQYRKFLLYREFLAAKQPVILTEGKTDKVHLRVAARQLALSYLQLEKLSGKSSELLFRIFPSIERRSNALLGLCGGPLI